MIGTICKRDVDRAEADEPVRYAAERMHQRAVGSLVIIDEKKSPIGIVTDRDLTIRVLAAGLDAETTPVRDVMTPSPVTLREDEPIEFAVKKMRQGAFRRIPVVDKGGVLIGLVSVDDILGLLVEEFTDVGALLERESPKAVVTGRL